MYSDKIRSVLKSKGIKPGDHVRVVHNGKTYSGILMPKGDTGDPDSVVLKLDSGYNAGIKYGKSVSMTRLKSGSGKLGKISKKLITVRFFKEKPPISMVSTGGTIASRIDYRTGGVTGISKPEEMLYNVPELAEIVNIRRMVTPFTKMSEDMDYRDWQAIAKAVAKELNSGSRGVIVTHGTDTLHFTSAALSFMLRELYKPVALVGSQRSADRGSSDGPFNLICAAHVSISNMAEVGICMHGEINDSYCLFSRGTKVRKMHTSRRDAFRPVNSLPIAKVWPDGKIEKLSRHKTRMDKDVEADVRFEPKIAIVKAYPGSDPAIMDYFVRKGCKGIVVEGTGLGHVPTQSRVSWISTIKKHVKDGIPVVVTPQTIYGRMNPSVYSNLRILSKAGAIHGEDMLTEVAYVKLGWVLGHAKDMDEVRRMMLTNYAGEINDRLETKAFLY
jgi:glutamyl-tRNA(Gln) amidotransferase subunit D